MESKKRTIYLHKIIPKDYAEQLKQKYSNDLSLWYERLIPREAAERLFEITNGDYSRIWHEHCGECFESIDKDTPVAYASEDGIDWLCENCYKKYLEGKCELFDKE